MAFVGSIAANQSDLEAKACVNSIPAREVPAGFEVMDFAGTGTFCEVWKLRRDLDGNVYAFKRLRQEWRENAAARRLLSNEAAVAKAVQSRNVVDTASVETAGTEYGIILEWLEGASLEQRLQSEVQIPIATTIWIIRQCAQGLLALQQAGYSHGDIKPSNIFLQCRGDVKLVDLGFARPLVPETGKGASRMLTGTAEYMAPESLSPSSSSPVARDVYSLGVTMFRMLTGELPFSGETTADVLNQQRTAKPPHLRRKCPAAPRELAILLQQMLAKQPIRRPMNLRALVRTLIEFELALFPQRLAG